MNSPTPNGPPESREVDDAHLVETERRRRWKPSLRSVYAIAAGVTLAAVASVAIYNILFSLRLIITMTVVAVFLAAALEPLVWRYQKLPIGRGRTLGRRQAAGAAMLTVAVGFISLIAVLVPAIYRAGTILVNNRERLAEFAAKAAGTVGVKLDPAELDAQISNGITNLGDWVSGSGNAIAGSVVGGLVASLAVAYLVWHLIVEHETLKDGIAGLLREKKQRRFLSIWDLAMDRVGKFIGANVILALIAGAVGALGAVIAGLPHPVGIGAWVFLANLIPIGGGFIGALLPIAVAVVVDLDAGTGLVATIVTIIIHTGWQGIDNYYLRPNAFGTSLEMHPAIAFLVIIGGTSLLGPMGAIVALPVTAVCIALLSEWKRSRVEANGDPESGPVPRAPLDDRDRKAGDESPEVSEEPGQAAA